MFPFWIEFEMTAVLQLLAGAVAGVYCLLAILTGHHGGV